jgi:hypothetical protein
MLHVHHCPRCDLRFATRAELEDHLISDHPLPVDDDTVEEATDR